MVNLSKTPEGGKAPKAPGQMGPTAPTAPVSPNYVASSYSSDEFGLGAYAAFIAIIVGMCLMLVSGLTYNLQQLSKESVKGTHDQSSQLTVHLPHVSITVQ